MFANHDDIQACLEVLQKGGIILYPTDTVWGIGCDATNEAAVQRILDLKGRVSDKGLIVLLDFAGRLETYVKEVPNNAWDLIEFAEKPLTIILMQKPNTMRAKNYLPGLGRR